jgi:hypothetical protein
VSSLSSSALRRRRAKVATRCTDSRVNFMEIF